MSIKKTAFIAISIAAIFVSANFMVAQATYEPLVRLPGLPADGPISLSQYVVGLYNFLLSIVGIVAVMMLIIGGMKYITAAGNSSVISDAKNTIWNAIGGLLLALLSWVIVDTINPDILFIRSPIADFPAVPIIDLSDCGTYDGAVCECRDGTNPADPVASQDECSDACKEKEPSGCGLAASTPCIGRGGYLYPRENSEGVLECLCVDDELVGLSALANEDTSCNDVCSNPNFAADGKYHGLKLVLTIRAGSGIISGDSGGNFVIDEDVEGFYDFSDSYDCKDELIHFAINFTGDPGWSAIPEAPDEVCCMQPDAPACPASSWGAACDLLFGFAPPQCLDDTFFPDSPDYPIYKHVYTDPGLFVLWIGSSADLGSSCPSVEKEFRINVSDVLP